MSITKTESSDNFETWLNKPFVSQELRESLSSTSILILPTEGFRDHDLPLFPIKTGDLFAFLKAEAPEGYSVEVCVNEEEYKEIALHSDYKRFGNFLVKEVALPVLIGLLILYVDRHYPKDEHPQEAPVVNTTTGANTTLSNSPNSFVVNNTTVMNNEKPVEKETPPAKKYHAPTKIKFSVTVVDSAGNAKELNFEGTPKDLKAAKEEIEEIYRDGNK